MAVNAGQMRKQVLIEERTTVPDAAGEPQVVWVTRLQARAEIARFPGREPFTAGERSGRVPTTFILRFRADVTVLPQMRLSCDGVLYDIISAVDPDGHRAELLVTCVELTNEPVNP